MQRDTRTHQNTSSNSTLRARNFVPAINLTCLTLLSPKLASMSSRDAPFTKMLDQSSAYRRQELTILDGTHPTSSAKNSSNISLSSSWNQERSRRNTPSPHTVAIEELSQSEEEDSPNPYSYLTEYPSWEQAPKPSPPISQRKESPPAINLHNLSYESIRNLPRDRVLPNGTRILNKGKHKVQIREFVEIKSKRKIPKAVTPIKEEESEPSLLWDQPPITRRPDTPFLHPSPSISQRTLRPSPPKAFRIKHTDFHVPTLNLHVPTINLVIEDKDAFLKKLQNKPLPPPPSSPSPLPPRDSPTRRSFLRSEEFEIITEAMPTFAITLIAIALTIIAFKL